MPDDIRGIATKHNAISCRGCYGSKVAKLEEQDPLIGGGLVVAKSTLNVGS